MLISCELTGKVLLAVMAIAGGIQLLFYWLVFRRVAFFKEKSETSSKSPVSVIVCAKNEASNLRKFLPSLLDQDYGDYEVVVVNDCSWDDSAEYLEEMDKLHSRLKLVTIKEQERYSHGKKFALTLGIKAASHDRLIFTDADCRPAGKSWVTSMASKFNDNTEIVLGYGAYERTSGFLNKLIRFDAVMIAIQYFSFAMAGNAYMGVGRNLAYRKTLFFRNKGFAKHNHLPSGDDDLLVNETATKQNTQVCLNPESFTYSTPKTNFAAWFKQKKRHVSTAKYYKNRHRLQLALLGASGCLFFVSLITLYSITCYVKLTSMIFVGVLLLKMPIFALAGMKFKEKDLILLFPIYELLHYLLQPLFFIAQVFSKNKKWK